MGTGFGALGDIRGLFSFVCPIDIYSISKAHLLLTHVRRISMTLNDQLTDEDIDAILLMADYFDIKWAAALRIRMEQRGLVPDTTQNEAMEAWEVSIRLQKRRRKLP